MNYYDGLVMGKLATDSEIKSPRISISIPRAVLRGLGLVLCCAGDELNAFSILRGLKD